MRDTIPKSTSKTSVISEMYLRVTFSIVPLDYSIIEFAKDCTSRKYYLDKLNNIKSTETNLYVSFMQIMGFECQLLHLVLIKPEQYMLVNVTTFLYPVTKNQVNEDGIDQLVNVFSYIKSFALEIKTKVEDTLTNRHTGKFNNLLGTSPTLESQQWKTKVS